MQRRHIQLFLAAALVGVALTCASTGLLGLLAVLMVDQRYFGLSANLATALELVIAWTPLSITVGIGASKLLPSHAVRFTLLVVLFALLSLVAPSLWSQPLSAQEAFELAVWSVVISGPFLAFAPAAAIAAKHLGKVAASSSAA